MGASDRKSLRLCGHHAGEAGDTRDNHTFSRLPELGSSSHGSFTLGSAPVEASVPTEISGVSPGAALLSDSKHFYWLHGLQN